MAFQLDLQLIRRQQEYTWNKTRQISMMTIWSWAQLQTRNSLVHTKQLLIQLLFSKIKWSSIFQSYLDQIKIHTQGQCLQSWTCLETSEESMDFFSQHVDFLLVSYLTKLCFRLCFRDYISLIDLIMIVYHQNCLFSQ